MSTVTGRAGVVGHRRGLAVDAGRDLRSWWATALSLAALIAALTTAVAAPASATSYGALAWGQNNVGQLGNGTTTDSDLPVAVSGLGGGVTAVSGGEGHSVALLSSGTVMAWGENEAGALGDGIHANTDVPVGVCEVGWPLGTQCPSGNYLREVTAVSAGSVYSLALLKNGTVVAWGTNGAGQLGDGNEINSAVPVAVSGLSKVTAISTSFQHSLALLKNGKVMAWGANTTGNLGNGTTTASDIPVAVSGLSEVTAISAGAGHSLALLKGGTVVAWGDNDFGQLGVETATGPETCGPYTCSTKPVAVKGLSEGVKAISAADSLSLVVLSNGTVMAWGENFNGELGIGGWHGPETCLFASCSTKPVAVPGLSDVTAVSGGESHSLALLKGGTVMAWGANYSGQLGIGTFIGPESCNNGACSTTPVAVSGLSGVSMISSGIAHNLAYSPPPPPPAVDKLSPKKGPAAGKTLVTITGSGLMAATAVKFDSTEGTIVTVNPEGTAIIAESPAGTTGSAEVTVTTPGGTSLGISKDEFTYEAPTVTNVSPNTGLKAGGIPVTVTGSGFELGGTTAFEFGKAPVTTVKCTSTTTCELLAPAAAKAGTVDVRATVVNKTSKKSPPADQFTYN
jgi:alpha-tubulin suppressor-like RCC1 family protein